MVDLHEKIDTIFLLDISFYKSTKLVNIFLEEERSNRNRITIKIIINMTAVDFLIIMKISTGPEANPSAIYIFIEILYDFCIAVRLIARMTDSTLSATGDCSYNIGAGSQSTVFPQLQFNDHNVVRSVFIFSCDEEIYAL